MKCARCGEELAADEKFDFYGQDLCEDCYIGAVQPPRSCDPSAVASAVTTRRQLGQKGTDGLTKLQKDIYQYVKERGSVPREELTSAFKLPQWEMEKQFAVLRHCELLRGFKEGDKIYITLM
ncbi:MAG: hypothetical protein K6U74_05330 [Firmicutes bacterium]|nr:hypothetical protein [Bacillota bacterium]